MAAAPRAMSLVSSSPGRTGSVFAVSDEARSALMDPAIAGRHVAVVSIVGRARSGKSKLMSLLADAMADRPARPFADDGGDVFASGDSFEPVTLGMNYHLIVPADDVLPCVLLLDVEGEGEEGEGHDFALLTLAASMSSVVVYNTRDAPSPAAIMRQLQLTARAARAAAGGAAVAEELTAAAAAAAAAMREADIPAAGGAEEHKEPDEGDEDAADNEADEADEAEADEAEAGEAEAGETEADDKDDEDDGSQAPVAERAGDPPADNALAAAPAVGSLVVVCRDVLVRGTDNQLTEHVFGDSGRAAKDAEHARQLGGLRQSFGSLHVIGLARPEGESLVQAVRADDHGLVALLRQATAVPTDVARSGVKLRCGVVGGLAAMLCEQVSAPGFERPQGVAQTMATLTSHQIAATAQRLATAALDELNALSRDGVSRDAWDARVEAAAGTLEALLHGHDNVVAGLARKLVGEQRLWLLEKLVAVRAGAENRAISGLLDALEDVTRAALIKDLTCDRLEHWMKVPVEIIADGSVFFVGARADSIALGREPARLLRHADGRMVVEMRFRALGTGAEAAGEGAAAARAERGAHVWSTRDCWRVVGHRSNAQVLRAMRAMTRFPTMLASIQTGLVAKHKEGHDVSKHLHHSAVTAATPSFDAFLKTGIDAPGSPLWHQGSSAAARAFEDGLLVVPECWRAGRDAAGVDRPGLKFNKSSVDARAAGEAIESIVYSHRYVRRRR